MNIILSPAKALDEDVKETTFSPSVPLFREESEQLVEVLKQFSVEAIKETMGVSDAIAQLNYERYRNWLPHDALQKMYPAVHLFDGPAYRSLDYGSLTPQEQAVGQQKLSILSGLYGLLAPHDLIQPHRLEMGTSFKTLPRLKTLYAFWGDKIRSALQQKLDASESQVLVNAASQEYARAAQLSQLKAKVITTVFKDRSRQGDYKVVMHHAKAARGAIARYILQHCTTSEEDLKAFTTAGYYFSEDDSTADTYVFLRDSL